VPHRLPGRAHEGAVSVEFALCLIPLLLLLAGIIDFADAFYIKQVVTNASRSGARYGIRYQADANGQRIAPSAANIREWVQLNYGADLTVTSSGLALTTNKPGDPLSVMVTKNKEWIFLDFLTQYISSLPAQISNATTMTLE
jgi:Flp pilus assembly protein TadG